MEIGNLCVLKITIPKKQDSQNSQCRRTKVEVGENKKIMQTRKADRAEERGTNSFIVCDAGNLDSTEMSIIIPTTAKQATKLESIAGDVIIKNILMSKSHSHQNSTKNVKDCDCAQKARQKARQ